MQRNEHARQFRVVPVEEFQRYVLAMRLAVELLPIVDVYAQLLVPRPLDAPPSRNGRTYDKTLQKLTSENVAADFRYHHPYL